MTTSPTSCTQSSVCAGSPSNNKEAATFYLQALLEDLKKASKNYFFDGKYVSYGDHIARERDITMALALVQNNIYALPIEEPTDEDLENVPIFDDPF